MEFNNVLAGDDATLEVVGSSECASDKAFIEANTVRVTVSELRRDHIIPVFIKDNEPVISQLEFIETVYSVARDIYSQETILRPNIRLSHPIKGRVPEAKNKAASELLEHEKTLYYERCAFLIEIPSVNDEIDGSSLNLCVGGVKAYNLDNLYNKKGADEHFKVFVGFQNKVCTNLCVWTDGLYSDIKVSDKGLLQLCITNLLERYNATYHLHQMAELTKYSLTEQQFAHLIGKCRMYYHLPPKMRYELPPLTFGDTQIGAVCRDYYRDDSFCRDDNGDINLWRLYNLLTGANKSSYIDQFLERGVNAYHFVENVKLGLKEGSSSWFLH